ncbi:glycosyltransferase family 2 protein [Blautia sp.]|uniref:glycosyltransferase family 2 protein n=1 Tax=Blautia sp. TaxID=1955243 RepID=UPI003AB28577
MISIIVPVYNCEKYVGECIESILAQTYTDWELILINDGSTDSSEQICKRYIAKNSKIRLISKENEGVSVARQVGVGIAKGDFIAFIDGDDCIKNNYLQSLIALQQKYGADSVFVSFLCFNETGYVRNPFYKNGVEHEEREVDISDFPFNTWYASPCVWGGIMSAKIIKESKLEFCKDYKTGEDMLFKLQYLLQSQKTVSSTDELYCYRQNPSSVLHTVNIDCRVDSVSAWSDGFELLSDYPKTRDSVGRIIAQYCKSLQTDGILHSMMNKEQKQLIKSKLKMVRNQLNWTIGEKLKLNLIIYFPFAYRILRKIIPMYF